MPGFNWFRLFNRTDFLALDVPSREFDVVLDGIGRKTILVVQGNLTSVLYEGTLLTIRQNDREPFRVGELAIHLDANNDVWLGVYSAT